MWQKNTTKSGKTNREMAPHISTLITAKNKFPTFPVFKKKDILLTFHLFAIKTRCSPHHQPWEIPPMKRRRFFARKNLIKTRAGAFQTSIFECLKDKGHSWQDTLETFLVRGTTINGQNFHHLCFVHKLGNVFKVLVKKGIFISDTRTSFSPTFALPFEILKKICAKWVIKLLLHDACNPNLKVYTHPYLIIHEVLTSFLEFFVLMPSS